MRLDDNALVKIEWDASLTFDPTGSTVNLVIDGTSYAMTWLATPVSANGKWTQTARSTIRFGGSATTVTLPDVKLTAGSHVGEPRVTTADGQIVPCYPQVSIHSY